MQAVLYSVACIVAEVVMCLDANDEFLKHRVMHLPQAQVEGTHNTEEGQYTVYLISWQMSSVYSEVTFV